MTSPMEKEELDRGKLIMDWAVMNWKRWIRVAGAAAALLVLLLGVRSTVRARSPDTGSVSGDFPTFEVQQGPLTVSVNVSGTIKAREQEIIKCEVEGQTTILYLVPEGEQVKRGDLLIELDASQLQDQRVDQEIRVQNAEASFIGAREQLEVTKNQAQSDVDKAELQLQFAEEDLKNFLEGEFPKLLKEAEARITLATGTQTRALERVQGSERLAEKGFITQSELEADRQDALKARLDLELSQDEKELLTEFTYKRQLAQLESDVRQAQMALERVQRKAAADVVQAEADLKAKESEYLRQKSKLEKIEAQIEKTKIYAPADGLVVYATSTQGGGWRGSNEPLAEGQVVRERQELIHLPTGSSFMAEVDVHEASLTKIKPGLPVHLVVNALPGSSFRGRVVSVAPLPDAQSVWMNPDLKVYNTIIHIESDTTGLRTGMTCLAEIIVDRYDDAVYVPVQSVVRVGGRHTVYVAKGKRTEPREVELGLDNNRMVRILSGLTPGEHVLLTPPLTAVQGEEPGRSDDYSVIESEAGSEQPTAPEATPSQAAPTAAGAPAPGAAPVTQGDRAGPGQRGDDLRERFRNASPEEREKMRQEWEERIRNLSPEERERLMQGRGRRRSETPSTSGEGTP